MLVGLFEVKSYILTELQQTITQKMAGHGLFDLHVSFTDMFCDTSICIWYGMKVVQVSLKVFLEPIYLISKTYDLKWQTY